MGVWVYTCSGTRGENVVTLSTAVYPTCTPASAGEWIEIEPGNNGVLARVDLTLEQIGVLLSTALIVWAVAWGFRQVAKASRGRG
jgi:hypothetical protein